MNAVVCAAPSGGGGGTAALNVPATPVVIRNGRDGCAVWAAVSRK
jgi:hypothetical protein